MTFFNLQNRDLGARTASVETYRQDFQTTAPAITGNEIDHLSKLETPDNPNPVTGHGIVEMRQRWDPEKLEKYRNGNTYAHTQRHMGDFVYRDRTQFYRPKVKAFRDNGGLAQKDTKDIVKHGAEMNFDLIALPDPAYNSSPREFEEHLELGEKALKKYGSPGMELVPTLTVKTDASSLISKLRKVREKGYSAAAVNVRSFSEEASLKAIRRFSMSEMGDMFLYAANCERMKPPHYGNINGKISARQVLPLFGFDMVGYAIENKPPGGDLNGKWLIGEQGVYFDVETLIDREEIPPCERRGCDGRHVSQTISDWEAYGKDYEVTWLHDVITIEDEFRLMREAIRNGELDSYYDSRPALKNYVTGKLNLELQS